MYDDPDAGNALGPPKRPVRIVVHDKAKHESRTFSCDAMLLRNSMAYFASVLDQLLEVAERSTNAPLSLNVNCDIPIFSWLMEYVHHRAPPMLPGNVVSLILSSNFLMMSQLYEDGLAYLKTHLVEVLLTDVNMDCIPAETTVKLAQRMSEDDIAAVLSSLIESNSERCANRSFLSTLLRHVVQQRYCDDPVSLCWCQSCGTLMDVEQLKAVNASVTNEAPCPNLPAGLVGSRGEVLKTHEATIAVPDNVLLSLLSQASANVGATGMLVSGSSTSLGSAVAGSAGGSSSMLGGAASAGSPASAATGGGSVFSLFTQLTGGDATEFVCWRLIGSCRFYRCSNCDSAVHLISMRAHDCGAAAVSGAASSSMNRVYCLVSAQQSREENLLNLFASVLPTLPLLKKVIPAQTALSSAVSSQHATAPISPYICPVASLDDGGASAPQVVGPILWRRGATHTNQAIQADGVPNVELIRFHETKMMLHLADYISKFSASQSASPIGGSNQPRGATSKGLSNGQRSGGALQSRGRVGSALGLSTVSTTSSGSFSRVSSTRVAGGQRRASASVGK